jgi:hypothetical protein
MMVLYGIGELALIRALAWVPAEGITWRFAIFLAVGLAPLIVCKKGYRIRYLAFGAGAAGFCGLLLTLVNYIFGCEGRTLVCPGNAGPHEIVWAVIWYGALLAITHIYVRQIRGRPLPP